MQPGTRYTRWTVTAAVEGDRVPCRCDCGVERSVLARNLRAGVSRSCGCLQREAAAETGRQRVTHGHTARGQRSPTYESWRAMVERCTNRASVGWRYYGGRLGDPVRVCSRWRVFAAFLTDMGERPNGSTLDRLDPAGHYACGACAECERRGWPANCAWATPHEQAMTRGADWFARLTREHGLPA